MAKPRCSEEAFIKDYEILGPTKLAEKLKCAPRGVYIRRREIEGRRGISIKAKLLPGGVPGSGYARDAEDHPEFIQIDIKDGVALVGSDLHIWPGTPSTAIRAFVHFIKEIRPKAVILDGDVMDFPRISRHEPIGWERNPHPAAELEAAKDILHDIEQACGRGIRKIWPLGNHDARFESNLARHCPEYANVHGMHLSDHFPNWEKCWLACINKDVAVKHRYKGGIHATHNNTLWAGKTMITGHLHSQKVTPVTDYNGTRYGVDTGCMADIYAAAFRNYTEESPRNWRAGFGVLTFKNGFLLPPELVTVIDKTHVAFRGELIRV